MTASPEELHPSEAEHPAEVPAGLETALESALVARGAVHASGLIGGIGLKAAKPELLRQVGAWPGGQMLLTRMVRRRAEQALEQAGIVYGVLDEELQAAVEEFVEAVLQGEERVVTRKIAQGEPPQAGQPAWIEYPLNYKGKPFRELANLRPGSPRKNCTVVQAQEVLAILHPPVSPKKGTSVLGESLDSKGGTGVAKVSLEAIAGENTEISGQNLVATCDGVCEEDAEGRVRVIPQIVLPKVDETTGRVPETGITRANVVVIGGISGQGVATAENLFIGTGPEGGTVEGRATIQARNLVLRGRMVGETQGRALPVEVEELCVVGEVVNRRISAGLLLIARDSQFARLEAERGIWVNGNLRGGIALCREYLRVRGDLGTPEGGSNTRIALLTEGIGERRQKKIAMSIKQYRSQLQELTAKLEELTKYAEKRAKADPYWARLLGGEREQPQGVLQIRALRQFGEYLEEKQQLERQAKGLKRGLARLAARKKEAEQSSRSSEVSIEIGGTLHLDVSFEIVREMEAKDEELPVSFAHEGSHFVRSTLAKVRAILLKEVNAYREQQMAAISEKRAAIEQMFEGQEKKPTVPELEDRQFELPIQWLDVEQPQELEYHAALYVRAAEPRKVLVRNLARVRSPQTRVEIALKAEGARGLFALQAAEVAPKSWLDDEECQQELAGLVIGEYSALEMAQHMIF